MLMGWLLPDYSAILRAQKEVLLLLPMELQLTRTEIFTLVNVHLVNGIPYFRISHHRHC
jgi:hypothetical protein